MDGRTRPRRAAGIAPFLACALIATAALAAVPGPAAADAGPVPRSSRAADPGCDPGAAATSLLDGVQVLGRLDTVANPDDVWKIEVPSAGVALNVSMAHLNYRSNDPKAVNFDLTICSPEGKAIGGAKTLQLFEADNLLVLFPGTYRINLTAVAGAGNYSLDGFLDDPVVVRHGDVKPGRLVHDSRQSANWYRIQLGGGPVAETVTARMIQGEGSADANLDVYLMDRWGRFSFWYNISWWAGGVEEVRGAATYSGWYYLKVHSFRGTAYYSLSIAVGTTPTDDDSTPANATVVPYNTTITGTVDQALDHYDFMRVTLVTGEEIDLRLDLLSGADDIFFLILLDEDLGLVWDQSNYIFEPQLGIGTNVSFRRAPGPGTYYIVVHAKVALTANVSNLADDNAHADYRLRVSMSLHPLHPPNTAPRISAGAPPAVSVDEDTRYRVDLHRWFEDPEGDPLAFSAAVGQPATARVDGDGILTVTAPLDWSGCVELNITARDPGGATARHLPTLCVVPRPEPPRITETHPGPGDPGWSQSTGRVQTIEGGAVTFRVATSDPDTAPGALRAAWTLDGAPVPPGTANTTAFSYAPPVGAAGLHLVRVEVTDGTSAVDHTWTVRVDRLNRPPVIAAISPANGSRVDPAGTRFEARSWDPEGDQMTWVWLEGEEVLADGTGDAPNATFRLRQGRHTLTLRVTDGRATAERTVTVESQQGFPLDATTGGILAAAAAGALAAGLFLLSRRRRPRADAGTAIQRERDRFTRRRGGGHRRRHRR